MNRTQWITVFFLRTFLFSTLSLAQSTPKAVGPFEIKPFRSFVTIKSYQLGQSGGAPEKPVQLGLVIKLPDKRTISLPEQTGHWKLKNSEAQEVNQTFEIPFEFIQNDGFAFEVEMIQKGQPIQPCLFNVTQLSQFNRTYFCRTDVNFQTNQQHLADSKAVKQGVEIKVHTLANTRKLK